MSVVSEHQETSKLKEVNSRKKSTDKPKREPSKAKAENEVKSSLISSNLTSATFLNKNDNKSTKLKLNKPATGLDFILQQQTRVLGESRVSYAVPTRKTEKPDPYKNNSLVKDLSQSKLDSTKITRDHASPSMQSSNMQMSKSQSRVAASQYSKQYGPKDRMIKKYLHNLVNESFESSPSPIKEKSNTDYYRVNFDHPRGSETVQSQTFENPYVVRKEQAASAMISSPLRTTKPMRS